MFFILQPANFDNNYKLNQFVDFESWPYLVLKPIFLKLLIIYQYQLIDKSYLYYQTQNRLQTHSSFLKSQFELVGDDPANQNAVSTNQLIKESEHSYVLWCSGRNLCEGMLVTLKVNKSFNTLFVCSVLIIMFMFYTYSLLFLLLAFFFFFVPVRLQ